MQPAHRPFMHLVPGDPRVLFIVRLDGASASWGLHCSRLLEGLKAASDLLRFGPVQRDEDRLDELLPWAGNV